MRPMLAILDNNDRLVCLTDDFFDGNLHEFLIGTAAFFKCSVNQKSTIAQYFKIGNKISFIHAGKQYHFDITDMIKNEETVTIQADSLTLELRNEDSSEFEAAEAMSLKEYLDVFLFVGDNPIVMGINEVSDKKIKEKWEGSEESILARLFSLANKFGAEIEFVTVLNNHWGLEKIVLNVYRQHDDTHQGIGKKRTDVLLEYGNNIETIEIQENIDNLKTAIRPIGKDGLSIVDVVIDEKDKNGMPLFISPKGDGAIRAVQARNQFVSKVGGEGYTQKNWSYDTDNTNVLAGQALAELKKLCVPETTVTIKGYEQLSVGDTVLAQNTGYVPTLNLSIRVSEQDIYFDDPSKNSTVFTNVEILKSEVDQSLLDRVNQLIQGNKKFDCLIVSDKGIQFVDGKGETTLTASVRDVAVDVTPTYNIVWAKDGVEFKTAPSIVVKATDVNEKAVYSYRAVDADGKERGRAEVTITSVVNGKGEDGKTSYVHTAYANSSDGLVDFTIPYPNDNLFVFSTLLAFQVGGEKQFEGEQAINPHFSSTMDSP